MHPFCCEQQMKIAPFVLGVWYLGFPLEVNHNATHSPIHSRTKLLHFSLPGDLSDPRERVFSHNSLKSMNSKTFISAASLDIVAEQWNGGYCVRTHNAGVVSSNPGGNYLMKFTPPEKTQSSVTGFCNAWNRVYYGFLCKYHW